MWEVKLSAKRYMLILVIIIVYLVSLYNENIVVPGDHIPLSLSRNRILRNATLKQPPRFKTNHNYLEASDAHRNTILRILKPLFSVKNTNLTSSEERKWQEISDDPSGKEKLIEFFSPFSQTVWFEKSDWEVEGEFVFLETPDFVCPSKCAITDNRMFLGTADAVVFSYTNVLSSIERSQMYEALSKEKRGQKWILSAMESPVNYDPAPLANITSYFDWTLTYRPDANFYWPYGYFYELSTPLKAEDLKLPPKNSLRLPLLYFCIPSIQCQMLCSRTKRLAASLISNCNSKSGRQQLINEMKKYIEIDEYGNCGSVQCPSKDCRSFLGTTHKFILAFENSLCQDYITEKFFKAFRTGAVPVTFGLGDYSEVAPPHSYINALDFPNVKALTDYLRRLDNNDDEYLKYFSWKLNYGVEAHTPTIEKFCEICIHLWEPEKMSKPSIPFDALYTQKRKLTSSNPNARNDTIAYKLLNTATTACVTIEEISQLNYFL